MRYRIIPTATDEDKLKFKVQHYLAGWCNEDGQKPFDSWEEARDHYREIKEKESVGRGIGALRKGAGAFSPDGAKE